MTVESEKLYYEINQRKDLLAKLNLEADVVEQEKKRAESAHRGLKDQIEEYRVPHVMDYVQVKVNTEWIIGR